MEHSGNDALENIVAIHESRLAKMETTCNQITTLQNDMNIARASIARIESEITGVNKSLSIFNQQTQFICDSVKQFKDEMLSHYKYIDSTIADIKTSPIDYIKNVDCVIDDKINKKFNSFALRVIFIAIGGSTGLILSILEILRMFGYKFI